MCEVCEMMERADNFKSSTIVKETGANSVRICLGFLGFYLGFILFGSILLYIYFIYREVCLKMFKKCLI